jgi:hypothetical protein
MNAVHLHLMLNHLPVIGSAIGVLLLAVALARRSGELTKVALGLFALLGVAAVAVFLTGEPAEDVVEKLPGFSHAITEEHEEVALVATIALGAFGALAVALLAAFRRRALPRWAAVGSLLGALAICAIMGYTAFLGGQIRHTEVRTVAGDDAPPAYQRSSR